MPSDRALGQTVVIGEHRVGIEPDHRLQMKGVNVRRYRIGSRPA